jgi:hypothetical protein
MSAPRRWSDSADETHEIRSLFAAGRPTPGISRDSRARLRRRLATRLDATTAPTKAVAWRTVAVAAVLGVAATAAGAVGVRTVLAVHVRSPSAAPAPPFAPAPPPERSRVVTGTPLPTVPPLASPLPDAVPSVATPAPAASIAAGASREAVAAPRSPAPDTPSAPAPFDTPEDTLAAELALLDEARTRYATDPRETLQVLDEHARRFPKGKLVLERELLALDALKALGRTTEERERAERLVQVVQGTIYERRVRTHLPVGNP